MATGRNAVSMPRDVKGGASGAWHKAADKKVPKVEELSPKGVIREVKDEQRRWKAEAALNDFERVMRHKQDRRLMNDVETMRRHKAACLDKIKCETSMKTGRY